MVKKTTKLKDVVAKIEASKKVIAKERDKIEKLQNEVQDLLDSFNEGIVDIQNGLDSLSEFI